MFCHRRDRKNSIVRSRIVAVFMLAMPFVSAAQADKSSWANLNLLQPGQHVQMIGMDLKSQSGKFASVTDTTITLHEKSGDRTIQKQDVHIVRIMKNKHRLRNTLIGAGVGAGLGAGIGAASYRKCVSPPDAFVGCLQVIDRGEQAAIFGVVGLVAGAAAGALWPTSEIIYRVPKGRS
jgi:hypothetical protein